MSARADAPPATRPAAVATTGPAEAGAIVDVRKTVEYLASDELEGRGTGTPGNDKAADHIANLFGQMKLQPPAGWDGYFQPFKITTAITVSPRSALGPADGKAWLGGEFAGGLRLTKDYQPLSLTDEGKFAGPVAFVGYGVTSKQHGYDDYAGVDVKGKVVLAMRFEPAAGKGKDRKSAFTGKADEWSPDASFVAKAKAAAENGAIALILVNPPEGANEDAIAPFFKDGQFAKANIPVIQVKRPVADALLAAGGAGKLLGLENKIDAETKPQSKILDGVQIGGEVLLDRTLKNVRNVAAVLPGKGPLASEYVVVGAHYDHLGRGMPGSLAPFSKAVHHGADDNASGTTAMLKLAEHFAKVGPQDRSILFVGFTGEEMGLLGSQHLIDHPPVPVEKMAGMLNLDMVGRVKDDKLDVGGSATAAAFEKILKDAEAGTGLTLTYSSKGGLGPSDHTSFAMKKVPVLFFFSGLHLDYHRPTDTADKVNYAGMTKVVALGEKVVASMAAMPRQQYVSTFDSQGMSGLGSGSGEAKVSLGVMPDYGDDTEKGVRITGARPGSAAEKAGLKAGDRIVGWGGKPMDNLTDMMDFLVKAKPGDVVKLKVLRDGKPVELEATLTERK